MKKYFVVSFEYDTGTYCTNIAHAKSIEMVMEEYSQYPKVTIREADQDEVSASAKRGMPIIEIE